MVSPRFLLQFLEGFAGRGGAIKGDFQQFLDLDALLGGNSSPPQTDAIKAGEVIVAIRQAVGGHVLAERGIPPNHAEIPDVDELVQSGSAAKEIARSDVHVAGDHDVIGEYIAVTDVAVMTDVGVRHEKVLAADGGPSPVGGAAVDGNVLAHDGFRADPHTAVRCVIKGQVLWVTTNDRGMADHAAATELDFIQDLGVGFYGATFSDHRARFNDCIGADLYILSDSGTGIDKGGRVDTRAVHDSARVDQKTLIACPFP